ncbi:Serine_palmitoyltransferase 2 [Hexamita inflata]|uniref:Serine palmitoyltransferase 2 n=1 Tax=Hexamita inflata TaxID=28002 RepID=A0AA86TMK2_9EUKA|nr:Serine palmitoyltransferase 2 [Hexamita inflata]CAI9952820.1 Serine palmitoyltransferase 2 [Hexamita inflata]
MSIVQTFKRYFKVEQDNPPKFQQYSTFAIFGFMIICQYIKNFLYTLVPRKFFFLKIANNLEINSLTILREHPIEDDLPPLPFKRTSTEGQLAGFKHEVHSKWAPTLNSFSSLYNVGAYSRAKTCFHREIASCPTDVVKVRTQDGSLDTVINICSYNYLGFAATDFATEKLMACAKTYGIGSYINRSAKDMQIFQDLETKMKNFMQVEDCIVHTMGYDTNAMSIPCIATPKSLIISDQFNHNSIVKGCQYSGAKTARFKHSDLSTLEKVLSQDLKKYDRVIVICEGLYSMEGSFVDLPAVVKLREKYGFLLFVDEAHSVGALGQHGQGVRDYFELPIDCVDFYMGTFTKSFASTGGYVAGKKYLIDEIRNKSHYFNQAMGMSPVFAQQIIQALDFMEHDQGKKVNKLKANSIRMRSGLKKLGFTVYGNDDSPVIPLLFYNPTKMNYLSDELLRRKIAAVVVAFPAVPIVSARIRFCMSASHTDEEIDYILKHMDQIGDFLSIKFEPVQK